MHRLGDGDAGGDERRRPDQAAKTDQQRRRRKHRETLVEIVEVLVLAIVAVATSWSGYAAAYTPVEMLTLPRA